MDWEDLRHFAGFVAEGSLSGAARRLGVEHATVARRIMALEDRLGLKLVDRRGRRLVATAEGLRVASIAARMASDAEAIDRVADGLRSDIAGEVVISAPPSFAAAVLAPKLIPLQHRHPALHIRMIGEARSASLERREADIAVRLSRPTGGDVVISKLAEMVFRLYASPDYLAATPEVDWRFIGSDGPMSSAPQQALIETLARGRPFVFLSDHAEIQLAYAAAGGGIAILPDFMVTQDVALVPVRPAEEPLRREVWLAVHADLQHAAPIRAVLGALRA